MATINVKNTNEVINKENKNPKVVSIFPLLGKDEIIKKIQDSKDEKLKKSIYFMSDFKKFKNDFKPEKVAICNPNDDENPISYIYERRDQYPKNYIKTIKEKMEEDYKIIVVTSEIDLVLVMLKSEIKVELYLPESIHEYISYVKTKKPDFYDYIRTNAYILNEKYEKYAKDYPGLLKIVRTNNVTLHDIFYDVEMSTKTVKYMMNTDETGYGYTMMQISPSSLDSEFVNKVEHSFAVTDSFSLYQHKIEKRYKIDKKIEKMHNWRSSKKYKRKYF